MSESKTKEVYSEAEEVFETSAVRVWEVCIVADRPDWAFANIAHQLDKHLGPQFNVTIIYVVDYSQLVGGLKRIFTEGNDFDLVHFLWRSVLLDLFSPEPLTAIVAGMNEIQQARVFDVMAKTAITTSIYDHLFLEDDSISRSVRNCIPQTDGYSVSSNILEEIYKDRRELPPPSAVLSDGVDLGLFSPDSVRPVKNPESTIRIGWTGNSLWGGCSHHKGLESVVMPAVEKLINEGFNVEGVFQDRQKEMIPHSQMPAFYQSLDIYVCASLHEGTPNPVLEAMASGLPVLSTDVGIVSEVFGPKQRMFIVKDRTTEGFYSNLRRLVSDAQLREELSNENLEYIQSWGWASKVKKWSVFFKDAISRSKIPQNRTRRLSTLRTIMQCGVNLGSKNYQINQLEIQIQHHQYSLGHAHAVLSTPSHRFITWLMYPVSWWVHRR